MIAAAASARLGDMFGYGAGELSGLPVETLVPGCLREAHRGHRDAWARSPSASAGAGAQLAGLRKDGTTFPVRVGLILVTAGSAQLTLVVIRDITGTARLDDLAVLAGDAAARQEHLQLLDSVIAALFRAGLSLQTSAGLSAGVARQRTEAVLGELDDIIRLIRGAVLAGRARPGPPPPRASGDAC